MYMERTERGRPAEGCSEINDGVLGKEGLSSGGFRREQDGGQAGCVQRHRRQLSSASRLCQEVFP